MKAVVFFVLVLGIAAVVVFHILRIKKGGLEGLLSKTVASLFFVLVAVLSTLTIDEDSSNPERFYSFIIMGLALGLVGDIMLDLKIVYKEKSELYTACGMISFMLAHLFYVLALMLSFNLTLANTLIPVAVALGMAAAITFSAPLFKLDYKRFKPLCFVYGFMLSWTMCQSLSAAICTNYKPVFSIMSLASVLFVISDIILSHMYFSTLNDKVESNLNYSNSPLMISFNHSTYYAAQYLIALSIMLI